MILFNRAPYCGTEERYIAEAIRGGKICGDGPFTKQCNAWLEERFSAQKVLLTTSGTTALDMAFLLCGLRPGDEVILPSFTFSSTATAAVLAGAKLVFVDVRPDTMNIDETKIEAAITDRTRVITVMHYAGVACEMDAVMDIARRHGLLVVEDAAQAVMSTYKGRALGTIGDLGCYSFHETKNYSMGEGGALVINRPQYNERAEILREKGCAEVHLFDLSREDQALAVERAFRCRRLALLSATYDGGLFPAMDHFLAHLRDKTWRGRKAALVENGSWAPSAARHMRTYLEAMKDITVCPTVHTLQGALKDSDRPALERIAEELLAD